MTGRDRTAAVFSALADPTRREVVLLLSKHGSMTATELSGRLPVTRQAVAKHLNALETAGLVRGERVGRENRYRLTPGPMNQAAGWMGSVVAQWDRRLGRLRRKLEHQG
ncbi:MAG: ArsR/SmtB family transcription factor [Actinomycetota bacterium]